MPQNKSVYWKIISLFIIQNMLWVQSQTDGSFEHTKHMFKWMGKKINTFYAHKTSLSGSMNMSCFRLHLQKRISSDKASNLPKRDVHFILLK